LDRPANRDEYSITRYWLVLAAVPIFLTLGGLWLGTTWFFARYSSFNFNAEIDYKLDPKGNADIIFYGDSTALVGIIPAEIERSTGLATYNLALSAAVVSSTANLTIDRYLASHRRPKLIVLYMTPWGSGGFTRTKKALPLYEAALVMLRYGSPGQVLRFFGSHPSSIVKTAFYNWRFVLSSDLSGQAYLRTFTDMERNRGFTPFEGPQGIPDGYEIVRDDDPVDRRFIEAFRRHYSKDGTRVVVYFPPLPDSDSAGSRYAGFYQTISDNEFRTVPHQLVAFDERCIHLLPNAAKDESIRVGEFLRRVLDGMQALNTGAVTQAGN